MKSISRISLFIGLCLAPAIAIWAESSQSKPARNMAPNTISITQQTDNEMPLSYRFSQDKYWRFFDHSDSLKLGNIRAVYQLETGEVWFGGRLGISRYNGKDWITYDTRNTIGPINVIYEDNRNVVWIGGEKGLGKFDRDTLTVLTESNGLPGPNVMAIHQSRDGRLWVGCGTRAWLTRKPTGGLGVFDGANWQTYRQENGLINDYVNDIIEDKSGEIWIATDGGISHFDLHRWRSFDTKNGIPHRRVISVYQSQDGAIWIGTETGTARYDRTLRQWQPYNHKPTGTQSIYSLTQTRDGTLWAFGEANLFYFENDLKHWVQMPIPSPGLGHMEYARMSKTAEEIFWFGGVRAARFTYDDKHWKSYPDLVGPPHQTFPNSLWFKNQKNEALRFDGDKWEIYPNVRWPVFQVGPNEFWSGGEQAILHFDGTSWRQFAFADSLTDILQTRGGDLWFVGTQIVSVFNGTEWQHYGPEQWTQNVSQELREKIRFGRKVVESQEGTIWFIPEINDQLLSYGLLCFKNGEWEHINASDVSGADQTDPRADRIYDLAEDQRGDIWVGTWKGLWHFNRRKWQMVTHPEGPQNRKVARIYPDREGAIWIACGGTRIAPGGVFEYKDNQWKSYTTDNGLINNDVWEIYQAKDNTIWFGTRLGVNRFDGHNWVVYDKAGGLQKDDVGYIYEDMRGNFWIGKGRYYGQKFWWTTRYMPDSGVPDTFLEFIPEKEVPTGNTTISWSGMDPWKDTPKKALRFSWKIDNRPWSAFSQITREVFLNLKSGNHVFQVRARDRDFNTDTTPARIEFTVLPPVWKQPWFLSLMAVLFSAIGYLSIRVTKRGRQIRTTNRALSEANSQLFQVNRDLQHQMAERERLDTQIQNLQFLYTLRAKLSESQSTEDAIQMTGDTIMDVLDQRGGATITIDEHTYAFGQTQNANTQIYQRSIAWGERERGALLIHTSIALSEAQERTLLDETAGQLTRTLEARELQMQLLQSTRLVSLGQMAAGVAHELNQPLGGISATAEDYYLRLQENMSVSSEQLRDTFKRILGMVDRMSHTVEHLRVFSRDTSQEPGGPLNLNDVIQNSLDIIGTQLKNHGIEINLELSENLPQIIGHPYQLEQIFLNLLGNARDALDNISGGTPTFRNITISTHQTATEIIARVQDNGEGVAAEHLNRIFEPFYTTKPADKGTGLGLSITYAIVKNHGGDITCTSRKDQGTTFEVRFPVQISTL